MSAPRALRIGFVIDRWQPGRGGAERALELLALHLERRGYRVLVFALAGPRPGELAPGTLHLVCAPALTRGGRERRFAERALASAREAGCELVVGVRHLPRADLYWPHGGSHAQTLELLGKRARGRHRSFLALERELLDRGGARAIVCVSSLVRDELLRRHPACAPRLHLVPNGVDLERFHPRERAAARAALLARLARPEPPLLGFAGRNARLKGLDTLLRALAGLQDRPWTLVAAGPARLRPWRRMARRLGLPEWRVHFASHLPALELAAGVDLALLPSRRDPAPLYLLEALASGTPVIASARAGTSECIGPESGALIADPEDVAGLRSALASWLERVESGAVDRERVRSSVAARGLAPWMEALERLLLELAPRASLP